MFVFFPGTRKSCLVGRWDIKVKMNLATTSVSPIPFIAQLPVVLCVQRYRWAAEKDRGALHGLPGFIAAGSDFSQLPRDLQFDDLKQLENAWLQHVSKLKASE